MGMTVLHIVVLSALALNYLEIVFLNFVPNGDLVFIRAVTVEQFIIGVQDIFVSYLLWFMMDSSSQPLYVKDNKYGDVF
jgi:hypothetical protein